MKKISLLFVSIALAMGTMAEETYTAVLQIQLVSQSRATSDLFVAEALEYESGFDATNSASLFPYTVNTANVNIFAANGKDFYAQYSAKKISNVPVGIITNREVAANQNYSFVFSLLDGRSLKFYDKYLDSTIIITSDEFTYDFTVNTTNCPSYVAGTNVTIADRFVLEPFEPGTGELEVCHVGDNLEIKVNPFTTNIVVKNADGQKVIDQLPRVTPQVISLKDLAKGRYTVEFNNGAKAFVIDVKPDVTPVQ